MAPHGLEVVFLGLTTRLYTLRALIVSSLFIVSVNIDWTLWLKIKPIRQALWIALYAFITIHHTISAFNWPILYGGLELPLIIAEVIGAGHYAARVKIQSWVPETLVFHAVLAWIIVGTLSLTICFRLADAIYSRGRSLIKPFDVLLNEPQPLQGRGTRTFFILFGRSIWRQNFVGENITVRAVRGVLAIIILSAVLFYTLSNVIFAPVKETALSPVKSFRISGYTPSDLLEDINIPAWDVTYALPYQQSLTNANLTSLISQEQFFSAVNVTAVWPSNIFLLANNSELVLPVCHQKVLPDAHNVPYYFYHCPPISTETSYILPDLQINVDFSPLVDGLSNIAQASARTQLPLLIGLANDLYDDIIHTVPVTFLPGVNMAASVIVDVRQVYTNGALAALGIFEITRTFWLPKFVAFYPDPAATFTGSNLSSLNVFWQSNYGELTFVQDYRENSVVAGFSSVGGLWTAFSGIFAIIFGASMLHTFYGSKPLSIFGIAHQFQAETMKKEAMRLYPNIVEENRSLEQRGLLSLLRDHLIDLSFLDDKKDNLSGLSEGRIKNSDEERVDGEKISKVPVLNWRDTDSSEIQHENGSTSNNIEEKTITS